MEMEASGGDLRMEWKILHVGGWNAHMESVACRGIERAQGENSGTSHEERTEAGT